MKRSGPGLDPEVLLKTTLEIASPSGNERAVAQHLVGSLQSTFDEAGLDAVGNVVARIGTGPVRVHFVGHIDTVPGEIPVRLEGDRLYGRGAVDAKGPFCAAAAAACQLTPETLERLTLTLVGCVEEEAPSSRGARHAAGTLPQPDALIVGEPSGWDGITLGYKGRLVARLAARREQFHSAAEEASAPERIVAAFLLIRDWVERFNAPREGLFGRVQLSLDRIWSDSDGLEQAAGAVLGFRLPLALSPETLEAELAPLVPEGAEVSFMGGESAVLAERDSLVSRAFRRAIRDQGGRPRFKLKTGTSDMNVLAPVWPVPMLAYGPGDSALDHRPNEHVSLREYRKAIEVLGSALNWLVREETGGS